MRFTFMPLNGSWHTNIRICRRWKSGNSFKSRVKMFLWAERTVGSKYPHTLKPAILDCYYQVKIDLRWAVTSIVTLIRYSTFVNWELWWPNFPILVYFKEVQTKPEGQIHFFPIIFVSINILNQTVYHLTYSWWHLQWPFFFLAEFNFLVACFM